MQCPFSRVRSIIEIVLFIDESRISSDVSRRNIFSKKFYSKNTKISIFTDYSSIINSDVFPAGKVKYEYFNIGDVVKCSPCSNAKDAFSALKLKYIETVKLKISGLILFLLMLLLKSIQFINNINLNYGKTIYSLMIILEIVNYGKQSVMR